MIITTAYHRKRNILVTGNWDLIKKSGSSELVVKKDIINEIESLINEMRKRYPEVKINWRNTDSDKNLPKDMKENFKKIIYIFFFSHS